MMIDGRQINLISSIERIFVSIQDINRVIYKEIQIVIKY